MAHSTVTTTLGALALGLVASACGLRPAAAERVAGSEGDGVLVPGAEATVRAPDAASIAGACTLSEPFTLITGHENALGVWRDPASNTLFSAARQRPNEAVVRQIAVPDGRSSVVRTILAPADSTIERVWRAHTGELLAAFRIGATLHLGRSSASGLVEFFVARSYEPAIDHALGPLDDPSDSYAAGMLSEAAGYIAYSTMCAIDTTAGGGARFCSNYWQANATLQRVLLSSAGVTPSVAHAHTYGGTSSTVVVSRGGTYAWEQLGRMPPGMGYGYARRTAVTDTSRGGPMAVPLGANAAVAWIDPQGRLEVQGVSIVGTPSADPVTLPFVDANLEDAANVGGEIMLTISTRADRADHPATTTLVRLAPGLNGAAPITVAPLRVPVANARIQPMAGHGVVFWSPAGANAVAAECGFQTQ